MQPVMSRGWRRSSMEYWHDIAIDRSWAILQKLRSSIDFVLIGGWAVYLLTGGLKSKDIDIITQPDGLTKLRTLAGLRKNPRLRKYECTVEGISVDVYVPFYSKLAVPVEEVEREVFSIEGFRIPRPEILLILKQQAELERKESLKGLKDRIDIVSLLINDRLDLNVYLRFLEKHHLANYRDRLTEVVRDARQEFGYLGIRDLRRVKLIKRSILGKLLR